MVTDAVQRDIDRIAERAPWLAECSLAATALALAAKLDDGDTSATAAANCSRELRDTFSALRALAPPDVQRDALDELLERRQQRPAA